MTVRFAKSKSIAHDCIEDIYVPNPSQLLLSGRCTVSEAGLQRDGLIAAVTSGDGVLALDLTGIEQADVTFVQLLLATQHEAGSRNRPFAVTGWSPAARDAADRAGLSAAHFAALSASGA